MRRWLSAVLLLFTVSCGGRVPVAVEERPAPPSPGGQAALSPVAAADRAIAAYTLRQIADFRAWIVASPVTTLPEEPSTPVVAPSSGTDLFVFLRRCETGWVDGIQYPDGKWDHYTTSYEGAYGFAHSTWQQYKHVGYPASANLATPEQQTTVAQDLYGLYNVDPWPTCGRRARALGLAP